MSRWLIVIVLVGCSAQVTSGNGGGDDGPGGPNPDGASAPTDASPGARPVDLLDDPTLVIIVGDSIAAGYNAANNNATGGRGYARLFVDNHAAYPAWVGRDMRSRNAQVQFAQVAESGATSSEVRSAVRSANLPVATGDVLVLINVGGNDFNDNVNTMISAAATAQAATLRTNLADIITHLRTRYENVGTGKHVVFAVDTIHDPTDGTGGVPDQFDDGFCGTLNNPLLGSVSATALTNLATMNTAIAAETTAQSSVLVDMHGFFMGHGMNAQGTARWIANDCAHPTSDGHHHLREAVWAALEAPGA